jgi:hypothetical protein
MMKTSPTGVMEALKLFDRPFLTSMGSAIDLLGLTFEKVNPDLSTGFQRDAQAIWCNFFLVGIDIQKSTEANPASVAAVKQ